MFQNCILRGHDSDKIYASARVGELKKKKKKNKKNSKYGGVIFNIISIKLTRSLIDHIRKRFNRYRISVQNTLTLMYVRRSNKKTLTNKIPVAPRNE